MIDMFAPAPGWALRCETDVREARQRLAGARQGRALAEQRAAANHRQVLQKTVDNVFLEGEVEDLREQVAYLIAQNAKLKAQLAALG